MNVGIDSYRASPYGRVEAHCVSHVRRSWQITATLKAAHNAVWKAVVKDHVRINLRDETGGSAIMAYPIAGERSRLHLEVRTSTMALVRPARTTGLHASDTEKLGGKNNQVLQDFSSAAPQVCPSHNRVIE
jgi:hypothetical protein